MSCRMAVVVCMCLLCCVCHSFFFKKKRKKENLSYQADHDAKGRNNIAKQLAARRARISEDHVEGMRHFLVERSERLVNGDFQECIGSSNGKVVGRALVCMHFKVVEVHFLLFAVRRHANIEILLGRLKL